MTTSEDPSNFPGGPAVGSTVVGIDVGGTSIKAVGAEALTGTVLYQHRSRTPTGDPTGHRLAQAVAAIVASHVTSVGALPKRVAVVVPGIVDPDAGIVRSAVNLGWKDLPLRAIIVSELAVAGIQTPVSVSQDVRAGALAEARALDGDGGVVAFVPLGTGVAMALVQDGTLVPGPPWAGEIGQVRIPHGPNAGLRVEQVASAGGIARALNVPDAQTAAERVLEGDPVAQAAWNECVDVLADALTWTAAVTGCSTVIVGGGLAESGDLLLLPLQAALNDRSDVLQPPLAIAARFGDLAGALGAVHIARDADASRTSTGGQK